MPHRPQVRRVARSIDRFIERVVVKIGLDVTANLIETTPVDTGWARANWVPSAGRPESNDPGIRDRSRVPGAQAKQAVGQAELLRYKLGRGKAFVTNNVPYIRQLNEGSSQQAPRGFVQRAVRKAVTVDIRTLRP